MNLIEGLQEEIKRVNEIIKIYDEIPAGQFESGMMSSSIKNAYNVIAIGDTILMMKAYNDLKEYEL